MKCVRHPCLKFQLTDGGSCIARSSFSSFVCMGLSPRHDTNICLAVGVQLSKLLFGGVGLFVQRCKQMGIGNEPPALQAQMLNLHSNWVSMWSQPQSGTIQTTSQLFLSDFGLSKHHSPRSTVGNTGNRRFSLCLSHVGRAMLVLNMPRDFLPLSPCPLSSSMVGSGFFGSVHQVSAVMLCDYCLEWDMLITLPVSFSFLMTNAQACVIVITCMWLCTACCYLQERDSCCVLLCYVGLSLGSSS